MAEDRDAPLDGSHRKRDNPHVLVEAHFDPAARQRRAEPNPETVSVLLDTAWRLAAAEQTRREGLERKASSVATFASVVVSLTAALGVKLANIAGTWGPIVYAFALGLLLASVGSSLWVLLPRPYVSFGNEYVEALGKRPRVTAPPDQVQGEAVNGLSATILSARKINDRNATRVFVALVFLSLGLCLLAIEAAALAAQSYT